MFIYKALTIYDFQKIDSKDLWDLVINIFKTMCVSSTNQKYILILYYFIILTEKAAVETPNLKSSGKFPYKKMSSFANLFDLIKFDAKVAELLAVRSL